MSERWGLMKTCSATPMPLRCQMCSEWTRKQQLCLMSLSKRWRRPFIKRCPMSCLPCQQRLQKSDHALHAPTALCVKLLGSWEIKIEFRLLWLFQIEISARHILAVRLPPVGRHIGTEPHFVPVGDTRNVKGGQKQQSWRSTHFVDQHICWCGWCSVTVRFVVSVLLDDPFCWFGEVLRNNNLYQRPILLVSITYTCRKGIP